MASHKQQVLTWVAARMADPDVRICRNGSETRRDCSAASLTSSCPADAGLPPSRGRRERPSGVKSTAMPSAQAAIGPVPPFVSLSRALQLAVIVGLAGCASDAAKPSSPSTDDRAPAIQEAEPVKDVDSAGPRPPAKTMKVVDADGNVVGNMGDIKMDQDFDPMAQAREDGASILPPGAASAGSPQNKAVAWGKTNVTGALDPDLARRVLRSSRTKLSSCHDPSTDAASSVHGHTELKLVVDASGAVTEATVSQGKLVGTPQGAKTLAQCIETAAKKIRFPTSDGAPSQLGLSIEFPAP